MIKKVLVFGLGAIGSILAIKLKNNVDLAVLVDENRLERYKRDGIIYNCEKFKFNYVLDTENDFKPDLIIIAIKSIDFEKNIEKIKNYVGENTIIMSTLNGITSEKILAKRFGNNHLIHSYFIGHSSMKHENKISFDGVGKIVFGDIKQTNSEKVLALKELFERCEIKYEISKNIESEIWQKFVLNVGVNQTLAILKMPFIALQKLDTAKDFMMSLMSEAVEIAKASGIKGYDSFIKNALEYTKTVPPDCKPSMLQDIENGKVTEVEIFSGEVRRLGKSLGINTPSNDTAWALLTAYNEALQWLKS